MKILVLGIGQSLRGDDSAGLEIVRIWEQDHPGSAGRVRVEKNELPGLGLLGLLEGMDAAVIVDAVQSSSPPGMLLHLGLDQLAAFKTDAISAHGWGAAETLQIGIALYPWMAKCRLTLIGIVGRLFDLGAGLSQEVSSALPQAVELVETEVAAWLESGK